MLTVSFHDRKVTIIDGNGVHGSTNGTFLNGRLLRFGAMHETERASTLKSGDEIVIAGYCLKFIEEKDRVLDEYQTIPESEGE